MRAPHRLGLLRVVGVTAAVTAATLGLAGCGVTEIPSASGTVTVWVDPPKTSAGKPGPAVTAASASTAGVPTTMVAGHAKGTVRSFREAIHRIDDAKSSRDYARFRSPSGNIFCVVDADGATCEVRDGRVTPPDGVCPAGGPSDVGRLELQASGAIPVCNSDTIRKGSPPKLPYQATTHVSGTDVTCLSEEAGVICVDQQGKHGFFIARGGFATF